jgi:hypothetical protein
VAIPCRLGNLVVSWTSGRRSLAAGYWLLLAAGCWLILLDGAHPPAYTVLCARHVPHVPRQVELGTYLHTYIHTYIVYIHTYIHPTPPASQSPQTPVLVMRLATMHQGRRTKIWDWDLEGGNGGSGWPTLAPKTSQDHSWGRAWRGSRYLKLRRCFINAGLPTLVRTTLAPLLVPFPFRLLLLAAKSLAGRNPAHTTCPFVVCPACPACPPVSLLHCEQTDRVPQVASPAACLPAAAHAQLLRYHLPPYSLHVALLGNSTSVPVLWPSDGRPTRCKLSLSVLGSPHAVAMRLAACMFLESWYRILYRLK